MSGTVRARMADFEAAAEAQIGEVRQYLRDNGHEATDALVLEVLQNPYEMIEVTEHVRDGGQPDAHGLRDCWEGEVADALARLWMARKVHGDPEVARA